MALLPAHEMVRSPSEMPTRRTALLLRRLGGIVRLLRPANVVMFLAGVVLGGWLVAGPDAFSGAAGGRLLLAAVSAALIGSGANALNDVFDLEIDRINRPRRPLPSGAVTPEAARAVWGVATAGGVALGGLLSGWHLGLAVVTAGLLYLYDARLKGTVGWGNGVVALAVALAVVYGGWAVGAPREVSGAALVGAAFAFLTTLAREVVKDVEDAPGDAALGVRTLATVYGSRRATTVALGVLGVTLFLTPFPYLMLGYGGLYLFAICLADVLLLRAAYVLRLPNLEAMAGRASALLKVAMVVGMGALALAGF